MSESRLNGKTRRRFLADMLFLGGGLTAAGLLAQTRLGASELPEPSSTPARENLPVPGEMVAPPPQEATEVPEQSPGVAGGMDMPMPTPDCVKTPEPSPVRAPTLAGRPAPPRKD